MAIRFKQGNGDLKPSKRKVDKKEASELRASVNPQGKTDNSHMPTRIGSQSHGLAMTNESKEAQKARSRGDLTTDFMAQGKTDDKVRSANGDRQVISSGKSKSKPAIAKMQDGTKGIKTKKSPPRVEMVTDEGDKSTYRTVKTLQKTRDDLKSEKNTYSRTGDIKVDSDYNAALDKTINTTQNLITKDSTALAKKKIYVGRK